MRWSEAQAEKVRELLVAFNGPVEVCAVMGVDPSVLDELCVATFGHDFAATQATFAAQGRAMVRRRIFAQAMDGDARCIDMLARSQLGLGPVEQRRAAQAAAQAASDVEAEVVEEVDALAGLLPD